MILFYLAISLWTQMHLAITRSKFFELLFITLAIFFLLLLISFYIAFIAKSFLRIIISA